MSSSGLIYAVIVGAWAAYLVPMWLRRQDELNEARPTERFSTAIRLLSGRAGMERRYAKDLRSRSADEAESDADAPGAVTDSVDVRAFAVSRTRRHTRPAAPQHPAERHEPARPRTGGTGHAPRPAHSPESAHPEPGRPAASGAAPARGRVPQARRAPVSAAAAARARRTRVLARRRRTTVMLFLAFTLGSVVAAVGGLAFLWAPAVPAVLLSAYIAYLRSQERHRFTFQMDRRQAEVAAQRLRDRDPRPRRRTPAAPAGGVGSVGDLDAEEPDDGPEAEPDAGMSALAADRRALVEQTDHAEWVDQQRERRGGPHGGSWDPVPVPLPTYVTAPVAPRATPDVDLTAPDAWSSARSSAVASEQEDAARAPGTDRDRPAENAEERPEAPARSDARRAASARRARERGRTPLFDQYDDGERPRAANE
ncbi:gephyrin-like molybdotransferase receptor GlpR [Streptomyces sp. AC512_CC834]|uniref:divisome protein SepX/GlpR n=1 Tax=Streptomyces sp. AC512_CC834 TaxID=2823691 RepID=UPI001C2709F4|nr:gephyrin-like molybdotransferase receptor GlpR [Streptomyces sp. AC512_CC834]